MSCGRRAILAGSACLAEQNRDESGGEEDIEYSGVEHARPAPVERQAERDGEIGQFADGAGGEDGGAGGGEESGDQVARAPGDNVDPRAKKKEPERGIFERGGSEQHLLEVARGIKQGIRASENIPGGGQQEETPGPRVFRARRQFRGRLRSPEGKEFWAHVPDYHGGGRRRKYRVVWLVMPSEHGRAGLMELRHLRYFVAVAEEENVTRAAARLHVSQPALTRQVRDLEAELGFALFIRSGKSLQLTEAGRVFREEAREVLARLETAIGAARAVASGGRGELHVGYAPSPSVGLLGRALAALQRTHPLARVVLHDETTPRMLEGLRARELHLALMMQPPGAALAGITFEPLRVWPVVVATSAQHRLNRKRQLSLEEVLREPIVAFSRKEYPDYHALLRRVLGRDYARMRVAEECDTGMSLIAAVEAGRGVAFTIAALSESAGKRLRFVPLKPTLEAAMGVAYLDRTLSPFAGAFLASLRAAATA